MLELASLALAIGSLASIVGVLGYYRNRPTADGPHALNLNTIISVLGTLFDGALMLSVGSCLGQLKWVLYSRDKERLAVFEAFDDASRGPIGAARLLVLRPVHLASIGCGVTLMALASDAFIQQSVSYPLRKAVSPQYANLSYAMSYVGSSASGIASNITGQIEPTLEAAIYDGALTANVSHTSSSISPQCPTGNCTFPEFASLAVCSRCAEWPTSPLDTDGGLPWLPNGLYLNDSLLNGSSTLPSLNLLPKSETIFVDASFLQIPAVAPDFVGELPATAYECTLEFCIEVYHSGVHQGLFTEKTAQVFSSTWEEYSHSLVLPSKYSVPEGTSRIFNTNLTKFLTLQEFFYTTLQGIDYFPDRNLLNMMDISPGQDSPDGFPVPQIMARIATSMTNNIRQHDFSDDGVLRKIRGTAYVMETYIHPNWLWLIYPLVMVLLTMLCCGLTIWQTRTFGMPSWKSSALAVMVHGIQEGEEDVLDGTRGRSWAGKEPISALEEWAEDVKVRIRRRGITGHGYGLVRAEERLVNEKVRLSARKAA